MATFAASSKSILAELITIVSGLPGIQHVYKGIPENLDKKVVAVIGLGGQKLDDRAAGGQVCREADYFVGLAYRVMGAEDQAEDAIADAVDALIDAVYANRKLGGLVLSASLDLSLASRPEFQLWAQREYRVFPVRVCTKQYGTFPLPQ